MVAATIEQTITLAIEHHRTGSLAEATALYRRVLESVPDHAAVLALLGVALHQSGQHAAAVELLRRSIQLDDRQPDAFFNLGCVLSALGREDEAIAAYKQSLALEPVQAPSHVNLGNILKNLGNHQEALEHYLQASRANPGLPQPHFLAGIVLDGLARTDEAIRHYERAVEIDPTYAQAHNNLGVALHTKDLDRAIEHYRLALDAKPNHTSAWTNLIKAISLRGARHLERGRYCEAVADYDAALSAQPTSGLRVRRVLALPVIYRSNDEILEHRKRLADGLDDLKRQAVCIKDPVQEIDTTPFYLAYHGQDDRRLLESLAAFYRAASPTLTCSVPPPPKRQRIRVGFVSRHLHRHTISQFMEGWIRHLDRTRFEVIVARIAQSKDEVSQRIDAAADGCVELAVDLQQSREAVGDLACDVLIYPDIGMEPVTYFLAFARLAPVQCAWWGHPSTTGIDTIDYYLSCDDLEPANARSHYSEELVRMKTLAFYTPKPILPADAKTRRDFGLGTSGHLYLCTQSLFKLHPDFDTRLGRILRADPKGRVVLFEGRQPCWTTLLRQRLRHTIGDVIDRVVFLPRQPFSAFLGLVASADVILDTTHFNGGNTTLQALAVGTPVVTEPGPLARGRITQACYRQVGLDDLVADSEDAYVELAVRLATDPQHRQAAKRTILASHDALYDNAASANELAAFLERVTTNR